MKQTWNGRPDMAGGADQKQGQIPAKTPGRAGRAGHPAQAGKKLDDPVALGKSLRAARSVLEGLRVAASPRHRVADLAAMACIACEGRNLSVCRYPAFRSKVFAGQILCQCGECGLAWVPGADLDLDAFYRDDYAQSYARQRVFKGAFYGPDNPLWTRPPTKPLLRARAHAAKAAAYGPLDRVLDIGAGVGYFLHAVPAADKYACELDPHAARILADELGVTLQAPGDRVDFFDLVMASHALEHFTAADLPNILTTIWRALRPGGVFLIEVPTGAEQLDDFAAGARPPSQRLEPHTLFFSSVAMLRLMRAAGFEVLEADLCAWTRGHVGQKELADLAGEGVCRDTVRQNLFFAVQRPKETPTTSENRP